MGGAESPGAHNLGLTGGLSLGLGEPCRSRVGASYRVRASGVRGRPLVGGCLTEPSSHPGAFFSGCISCLVDTVRERTETCHRLQVIKDSDNDDGCFFTSVLTMNCAKSFTYFIPLRAQNKL